MLKEIKNESQQKIYDRFVSFCSLRTKVGVALAVVVLVLYYFFIILVGSAPDVLGYKVGPSSVTVGIVYGLFVIVTSIVTTGLYTFIANKYFDKELSDVLEDMRKNDMLDGKSSVQK